MTKKIDKVINSDGVTALAGLVDLVTCSPIATVLIETRHQWTASQDHFFEKRIISLLEAISEIDQVLLGQTIENLRQVHGADYFDETLFNAAEKCDSVRRTKMIAQLLINVSSCRIPNTEFWSVLHALQNLTIDDLTTIYQSNSGLITKPTKGYEARLASVGLGKFISGAGTGTKGGSLVLDREFCSYVGCCVK